jgi:predicted RNase H-like HicB family nuclease
MSKPNYRVICTFDADRKVFAARAPELEHCTAEGTTRAEAIGRLEEEIDAQLANMLSHGATPPKAVDEETFTGEITCKVSALLHRDLSYQARSEGIDLDHLVGELLSAAVEARKTTHRGRSGNRQTQDHVPHDNIGNRHEAGNAPRRQGFGGRNNNNFHLLDDRANFIEYVRGLEQGGPRGASPGGAGPGGGDRGRRRRRGGPGGGGNRPHQHDGQHRHGGQQYAGNRNGGPSPNGGAGAMAAPPAGAPPSGEGEGSNG